MLHTSAELAHSILTYPAPQSTILGRQHTRDSSIEKTPFVMTPFFPVPTFAFLRPLRPRWRCCCALTSSRWVSGWQGLKHGTSRGPKKHINFLNINFLAPTQNTPFRAPEKNLCASVPGKGRKKRNPHKVFQGDLGGVKKVVPNGPFSATKSLVYCFFSCP